jgi:hypothetical protein
MAGGSQLYMSLEWGRCWASGGDAGRVGAMLGGDGRGPVGAAP